MASVALVAFLLFIVVLLSGPLAVFFAYMDWAFPCVFAGTASVVFGLQWFFLAPSPMSCIGAVGATLGAYGVYKLLTGFW